MRRRVLQVIGIILAFQALVAVALIVVRRLMPTVGGEESDVIELNAVAQGIEMESRATAFRGGAARAIMGGLRLDLRNVGLGPEGAALATTAIMGGVELIVPPTWQVRIVSNRSILGGIEDETEAAGPQDTLPRLDLDVTAVMGGVRVMAR